MNKSQFEIAYTPDGPAQVRSAEGSPPPALPPAYPHAYPMPPLGYPYRERFRLPAIVNTALTLVVAGAVFFGAERFAPEAYKPSTLVGGYEAGVETQIKAAELNEQARFAAYEAELRLAVEMQAKQNELVLQGVLQNYQALYERGRMMAEAAMRIQTQYISTRMSQQSEIQSADMGIISMSTLIGRALNLVEPGAGDQALAYAGTLSEGVIEGMADATREGAKVDLTDWNVGVIPPEAIKAELARVVPPRLPTPPHLARHVEPDADLTATQATER